MSEQISNAQHSSTQSDADKIHNPDFTGKWRLKEYVGVDEYLKSEGWNWVMRKTIAKLGNSEYIYHHHISSLEGKEEEHITIKSVYKGGVYEMISCVNLNDKKEIKYKDKNGNKVISVFKWNKDKTQIIEFLLTADKERENDDTKEKESRHKHKRRKRQKSYTRCRHMDKKGQMIETITNQHGKTCTSIYVKDEEDQLSVRQLKHILHLPADDIDNKQRQNNIDSLPFPINILELEQKCNAHKEDEDRLVIENIAIQKDIEEIRRKILEMEKELRIKTDELKANIAANDENISHRNTVKKWAEFERNWCKWDTLYFIGWLRRIKWKNKQYEQYHITKYRINQFCLKHFGELFLGKYLLKFECDTMRQLGIEDEEDSFCIYQQILKLTRKYPMKVRESPLKYEPPTIQLQPPATSNDISPSDAFKTLLSETDVELLRYYPLFKKIGFDDINTICACIEHKGIQYLEDNVLSNKLKMNNIALRIKVLDVFKKQMEDRADIITKDNENHVYNENLPP